MNLYFKTQLLRPRWLACEAFIDRLKGSLQSVLLSIRHFASTLLKTISGCPGHISRFMHDGSIKEPGAGTLVMPGTGLQGKYS